ncbi:MAG: hypothetical protein U0U67_11705 [Chitinophagales bacterium]
MKYFPYENYSVKTNLSVDQIVGRLHAVIETEEQPQFPFYKRKTAKPYYGVIDGNTFKITRIINYRNSFLPQITGTIEENYKDNSVHIKMKLHTFVIIFMLFWLGFVFTICTGIIYAMINHLDHDTEKFNFFNFFPTLIPFGMLIFGYLLMTLPFKYESKKAKEFLNTVLEADDFQNK